MGKTVLIAVLDWGLGHATRMVPVIDWLIDAGANPVLASGGSAATYLRARFPNMQHLQMPSPQVKYNKRGARQALFMRTLSQPAINRAQHAWVISVCKQARIDGIISDNVYGAYHPNLPTVVITHQVGLMAPFFNPLFDRALARWLNRFGEVWIPDMPGADSLAGRMTENPYLKRQARFIGRLSRLSAQGSATKEISLLALVSGPEPQRSAMEAFAMDRFADHSGKLMLVRGATGLPGVGQRKNLTVHDFLDGEALALSIARAESVLCRSGYSTLCDLLALGARGNTLPTPQQPEQIYLARRCHELGWFETEKEAGVAAPFKRSELPQNDGLLLPQALQRFIEKL